MIKNKDKQKVIKSMHEFEQRYFPTSFKKKMAEQPSDAHALGVNLAKESLEKVRRHLSKSN